jgi:DmsE family decaheme c-type cytochrome
MVGERNSRTFWSSLLVFSLALGLASLSTAPSALGAEAARLAQAAVPTSAGTVSPPAASTITKAGAQPAASSITKSSAPAAAPESAASPAVQLPPGYVDNSTCTRCHEVETKNFKTTMMGHVLTGRPRDEQERLGCQACHGGGREHLRHPHKPSPGFLSFKEKSFDFIKMENARCLQCHQSGERAFWQASTHAFRGVRCVDCHNAMCPVTITEEQTHQIRKSPLSTSFVNPFIVTRPETQVCLRCHLRKRMQINLPSHMPVREGLMTCVDCHNPHGGPYPHQLRAATVNEVCYRCHAQKRGPFLWIHVPVVMNCLNCHDPHGSVNLHMLVINLPMLCQRCHIGTHHPSSPHKPGQIYVINQQCTNCHSQIHGSNSPGGRVFTR